jgi:hypothetical protein
MSAHQIEDSNLEGVEEQDGVELFDVGMLEGDIQGGQFHTKNNLKDPYQRREIIRRTGHGVDIRCTLIDAIHGVMSEDSDYWATLLVLQFRFDPQKRARQSLKQLSSLSLTSRTRMASLPEVEAVFL